MKLMSSVLVLVFGLVSPSWADDAAQWRAALQADRRLIMRQMQVGKDWVESLRNSIRQMKESRTESQNIHRKSLALWDEFITFTRQTIVIPADLTSESVNRLPSEAEKINTTLAQAEKSLREATFFVTLWEAKIKAWETWIQRAERFIQSSADVVVPRELLEVPAALTADLPKQTSEP